VCLLILPARLADKFTYPSSSDSNEGLSDDYISVLLCRDQPITAACAVSAVLETRDHQSIDVALVRGQAISMVRSLVSLAVVSINLVRQRCVWVPAMFKPVSLQLCTRVSEPPRVHTLCFITARVRQTTNRASLKTALVRNTVSSAALHSWLHWAK